jgi:hypothetical protein
MERENKCEFLETEMDIAMKYYIAITNQSNISFDNGSIKFLGECKVA